MASLHLSDFCLVTPVQFFRFRNEKIDEESASFVDFRFRNEKIDEESASFVDKLLILQSEKTELTDAT